MAEAWEIREGTREDLPRLEAVWRTLHAHHSDVATGTLRFIPADERWPSRLAEFQSAVDDRSGFVFVAVSAGEPIGFAFSLLKPTDPIFASGPVAELEVLVVAPERRGEGIGEELVRRSLDRMREEGAETVEVVAIAGNDDALKFYRRFGIQPARIELSAPLGPRGGESGSSRN